MVDMNSEDKRLRQDRIERDRDAQSSTRMLVTGAIIILAIIIGIYLYQQPTRSVSTVETTPAESTVTTDTTAPTPAPVDQTTTQQEVPAATDNTTTTTEQQTTAPATNNTDNSTTTTTTTNP